MMLFDFDKDCVISDWEVVDDVVMGGRSSGNININQSGNAVFHGMVSLENNGGFSMVRYQFKQKDITNYSSIAIRLEGDGKPYQFRVKSNKKHPYSYIHHFRTSGTWQTIEIPLMEMVPFYRGKKLDMPDYEAAVLEEIAFLIGNKRAEAFRLEIDHVVLR
jgi:hypothetical protein